MIIDRRGHYTLEQIDQGDGKLVWLVCYDGLAIYTALSFERARSYYVICSQM